MAEPQSPTSRPGWDPAAAMLASSYREGPASDTAAKTIHDGCRREPLRNWPAQDAAGDANDPVPPAREVRSDPVQASMQAADAGPRHTRDEEPQEAIGSLKSARIRCGLRVGHQLAAEEAGPLHPARALRKVRPRASPPARSSRTHNDATAPSRRVVGDVPPGGTPRHAGEDASCRSSESGHPRTAHVIPPNAVRRIVGRKRSWPESIDYCCSWLFCC